MRCGNIPCSSLVWFCFSLESDASSPGHTGCDFKKLLKSFKPGGHFLIYLYYSLDNRVCFFKMFSFLFIFWEWSFHPFASFCKDQLFVICSRGFSLSADDFSCTSDSFYLKIWYKKIPLLSLKFQIIRNDALDRLGTNALEKKRFSRKLIEIMLTNAGLTEIVFSGTGLACSWKEKFKLPTSWKILFVASQIDRAPGQRFRFEQYFQFLSWAWLFLWTLIFLSMKNPIKLFKTGHYFQNWKWCGMLITVLKMFVIETTTISFYFREAMMLGTIYFERN